MRGAVIASVLALLSGSAGAEEFRDACPAGNMKKYPGTNPRWLGATPQQDSELVPSRVVLGFETAYYVASTVVDENGPREQPRARVLTEYLSVHQNLGHLGLTAQLSASQRRPGDYAGPSPSQLGNVVLAAAYRRHLLYAFFGQQRENDEKAVEGSIAGLRVAYALGASLAVPTRDDRDAALQLASFAPFDLQRSSPKSIPDIGGTAALTGEIRIESVGCYAPFIHLKATAIPNQSEREMASDVWTLSLSQSIAIGMYVSDHNALYLQYALALLGAGTSSSADAVHRLRAGLEHSRQNFAVGVTIDVMRGSEKLNGFVIGVYLAPNWEN